MQKAKLFLLFLTLVITGGLLAAEAPVYHPVKAEKIRLREGCPNIIRKMKEGARVRIGYLGGSITAQNGWRVQTLDWFKKTYPNAQISEINAAIGGTGSDLGVYRVGYDVLRHEPDLVFVEFAVNDGGADPLTIWRNMEGIIRLIWRHNSQTDIMFVYTYRLGNEKDIIAGNCPQSSSAMEILADFYGIPSVNFMVPTVAAEQAGKLIYKSDQKPEGKIWFSTDGVHPRNEGHEIYTAAIADAFTQLAQKNAPSVDYKGKLNSCFVENNNEKAQAAEIKESMLSGSWTKMTKADPLFRSFSNRLGETIFTSGASGDKITFKFKGSSAKIYDLLGPNGGQVWITVDGKKSKSPTARFDSYCTYHRLATLGLAIDLDPNNVHTITVEIDKKQPNRQSVAFRLKNPEKELQEAKFQGKNVWFGKILLLGEIVD